LRRRGNAGKFWKFPKSEDNVRCDTPSRSKQQEDDKAELLRLDALAVAAGVVYRERLRDFDDALRVFNAKECNRASQAVTVTG
jgi:hypothetical protein